VEFVSVLAVLQQCRQYTLIDAVILCGWSWYLLQVHKFSAHTLYSVSKVLAMNNDQPVTTFKEFKELLPLLGAPEPPINSPELAITKLLTCEDEVQGNDYRWVALLVWVRYA